MAKNNEISFDGLDNMDFSVFHVATKADFPDGRYSGVINGIEGKTRSSKGASTLRIEVSMTIDKQTPNGPTLKVKDFITFTTSSGFSWASANTWSDLCEIAVQTETWRTNCANHFQIISKTRTWRESAVRSAKCLRSPRHCQAPV